MAVPRILIFRTVSVSQLFIVHKYLFTMFMCFNSIQCRHEKSRMRGCRKSLLLCAFDVLFSGPLSRSILAKAGKELQTECHSDPVRKATNIRVTNGMKLKCKYVAHLVTPRSIDEYAKRIKSALDCAEVLGVQSVALPTLGAGE